jgi:hypothetical protein
MSVTFIAFCKTLFFLKALFAVLLACTIIGLESYMVYIKYETSIKPLPSIEFPPAGAPDAEACYHRAGKARLEPPNGAFFFGFSLDWSKDLPQLLSDRMNLAPSMVK